MPSFTLTSSLQTSQIANHLLKSSRAAGSTLFIMAKQEKCSTTGATEDEMNQLVPSSSPLATAVAPTTAPISITLTGNLALSPAESTTLTMNPHTNSNCPPTNDRRRRHRRRTTIRQQFAKWKEEYQECLIGIVLVVIFFIVLFLRLWSDENRYNYRWKSAGSPSKLVTDAPLLPVSESIVSGAPPLSGREKEVVSEPDARRLLLMATLSALQSPTGAKIVSAVVLYNCSGQPHNMSFNPVLRFDQVSNVRLLATRCDTLVGPNDFWRLERKAHATADADADAESEPFRLLPNAAAYQIYSHLSKYGPYCLATGSDEIDTLTVDICSLKEFSEPNHLFSLSIEKVSLKQSRVYFALRSWEPQDQCVELCKDDKLGNIFLMKRCADDQQDSQLFFLKGVDYSKEIAEYQQKMTASSQLKTGAGEWNVSASAWKT